MPGMTCFEHTDESFSLLIDEIRALGYDEETAGRYAVIIGDTPIADGKGNTLVLDEKGNLVVALPLS